MIRALMEEALAADLQPGECWECLISSSGGRDNTRVKQISQFMSDWADQPGAEQAELRRCQHRSAAKQLCLARDQGGDRISRRLRGLEAVRVDR